MGQREGKGKRGALTAARARKFTINNQGKGGVTQVYFPLPVFAAIFAKLNIDSNSLK